MKRIGTTLLGLLLAACQPSANDSEPAIDRQINATSADATKALPSSGEDGKSDADIAVAPTKVPTAVPAQFQGRWGINRSDCTSTRGDAKGLLTINDAGLNFYESRGALNKVLAATATGFDARYDFVGEGQTWKRTERLSLVNDQLHRQTDAEPGQEPPVNLTYQRCRA